MNAEIGGPPVGMRAQEQLANVKDNLEQTTAAKAATQEALQAAQAQHDHVQNLQEVTLLRPSLNSSCIINMMSAVADPCKPSKLGGPPQHEVLQWCIPLCPRQL